MKHLELRIPPPLIALTCAIGMWLISIVDVNYHFHLPEVLKYVLILALVLAGLTIDISAIVAFRRAKTTVNPVRPENTSALVDNGIYRLSRNPMYLGLLLFLCAISIYLSSALALLVLPSFVWYLNTFQIKPEESMLHKHFGQTYLNYCQQVRRWI